MASRWRTRLRHARLRTAVFALLASCVVAPAQARAEPAEKVDLANEDALVRYALSHNPDLRAQRWNESVAKAGVETARALSNPIVRGEWLHVQSPANFGWGVGLEWAPPQPGVYGATADAAHAQVRAVTAGFAELRAELEASVRVKYAQVAVLESELELAEKSINTRRAIHVAVTDRLAHGAGSRIDVSLTAVSLARSEQERDELAMKRAIELTKLEALLGLPLEQSLDTSAAARVPDSVALPAAYLHEQTSTRRPQLEADAARASAAGHSLAAERARRWPWLSFQARFRRNDQSNYPNDTSFGVELTLPIFDRNAGPIAAAEAAQASFRDLREAHRARITREVRLLHVEALRRRAMAEHFARAIIPVLREHAALVKQAVTGMEVDLTALLAAEDVVTKGGIEYLEARLAQRCAEIALSRAVGEFGK